MTEAEWLECTDPWDMLEYLRSGGKSTERQVVLFAVAVCRNTRLISADGPFRNAVEAAARYADGRAEVEEVEEKVLQASWEPLLSGFGQAWNAMAWAASTTKDGFGLAQAALQVAEAEIEAGHDAPPAHLLRCLIGNPFRPRPVIDPFWLRWNDGTVLKLALEDCSTGTFDRLPILADALEEAGCDDADILGHLRSPGLHVRGCWVLDLLLGKE